MGTATHFPGPIFREVNDISAWSERVGRTKKVHVPLPTARCTIGCCSST